jgi:hypothetical protein
MKKRSPIEEARQRRPNPSPEMRRKMDRYHADVWGASWPERRQRWDKTHGKLASEIELRALEIAHPPNPIEKWQRDFGSIVDLLGREWAKDETDHTPAQRRELLADATTALVQAWKSLQRLPRADRYRLFGAEYPELVDRIHNASNITSTAADRVRVKHSGGPRNRETLIKEMAAHFAFGLMLDATQNPTTTVGKAYVQLAELLVEAATGREATALRQCRKYVANLEGKPAPPPNRFPR